MKKISVLLLVVVISFSFFSCDDGSETVEGVDIAALNNGTVTQELFDFVSALGAPQSDLMDPDINSALEAAITAGDATYSGGGLTCDLSTTTEGDTMTMTMDCVIVLTNAAFSYTDSKGVVHSGTISGTATVDTETVMTFDSIGDISAMTMSMDEVSTYTIAGISGISTLASNNSMTMDLVAGTVSLSGTITINSTEYNTSLLESFILAQMSNP